MEKLDIIQEMAKRDLGRMESQFERIYEHLLKYKYQKDRQTRSWINTIIDSKNNIEKQKEESKSIWNYFGEDHLDDIYKKSVRKASKETGLDIKSFPIERPKTFTKENMINDNFIESYFKQNAYTTEAKYNIDKIYG